ncbi:MAG: sigma-E factor regulatory protein RseB domain-containing protein [Acidimicrobiia bacterium]
MVSVLVLPSAHAGSTDPADLLEQTRAASAGATVAGVVEVRWLDGETVHVGRTGAHARGGAYVVGRGDDVAVGVGGVRWAATEGINTWNSDAGRQPPHPGAAWDLSLDGDAEVAGRPVTVVVARRDDGPVRARFFIDQASGLLLRRDVLQRDGEVVRSVRYTQVATDAVAPPVLVAPPDSRQPVSNDGVGDGFVAPERLDDGFRLLGHSEHPDGAVQLFYSDGLFSLSLFQQQGLVDWGSLPDGGRPVTVDSDKARWYSTDAGSVVVWGRDGLVLTGVSDAPPDTVRAAVATIDGRDTGVLEDIADFVLGPFGWE